MKTGQIVGRDDVNVADLFDMNANLISQINLLESVVAMLSSIVLADHDHYETPPSGNLVNSALDCLGDYLNEYERAQCERDIAINFLNLPE